MTNDLRAGRAERLRLIEEIERSRDSKVIVYICGDREPTSKTIDDSDVRPLFDHIKAVAPSTKVKKIDLFLYSNGGDVDVPWRIVSMIREHADTFGVLIPYRAYSAATMIVLAADELVLTRKAELGPIDAAITFEVMTPNGVERKIERRVEDAMAYVAFFQQRVGIKDPVRLTEAVDALTAEVGAIELGMLYRTQRHTRTVAELLLNCRVEPPWKFKRRKIIDTLARQIDTHEHGLSRREVEKLGLPVAPRDPVGEDRLWRLFALYERDLRLRSPIFEEEFLGGRTTDERQEPVTIGVLESTSGLDEYAGTYRVRRVRSGPPEWTNDPRVTVELPADFADADSERAEAIAEELVKEAQAKAVQATRALLAEVLVEERLEGLLLADAWRRTAE